MLLAKVVTQLDRIGHMSSFSTGPNHTLPVKSQQPPPSPWFSFDANNPETDHPPSPMETVHHKLLPGGYSDISSKVKRAHEIIQMRLQQRAMEAQDAAQHHAPRRQQQQPQLQAQQHYPVKENQPQLNYPTVIEFKPSRDDDCAPFDEQTLDDPPIELDLGELSLGDTFGFSKNTKSDDDLFEKIYAGIEEEEGTLQSSSVELNPYPHNDCDSQRKRINEDNQGRNKNMQQDRDSIFRSHWTASANLTPQQQEKNPNNTQLVSPTEVMDRRFSSRLSAQAQEANFSLFATDHPITRNNTATTVGPDDTAASTSRSRNRSTSRSHRSLKRNNASTSVDYNNAGLATSPTSRTRNHSKSRIHRSSSRGTSRRRRSRSRSTSIAPPKDDYHANLFKGAALIREQLLRSMASADEAMDEADREFMEQMIERGGRQQQFQAARLATSQNSLEDSPSRKNDFDHSIDEGLAGDGSPNNSNESSPSRSSCSRFEASRSQGSSAFETESRRLDSIVGIFAANSSTTSSIAECAFTRTSLDAINNGQKHPKIDNHVTTDATHVITSTPSLDLSSPLPQTKSQPQIMAQSPAQNYTHSRNGHDASWNNFPADKIDDSCPKQCQQKSQTTEVDEALAHAEKAGPVWRSLVGNHVRFPSKWDGLLPPTSPAIYGIGHKWSKWYYVARHRVKGDKRLNSTESGVRSRRSGGRILMRMIIRGVQTQQVCREIVIGCFHPNSKGIRKGDPCPEAEDVREIWMAVRWLIDINDDEPRLDLRAEGRHYEGVVDNFLMQKKKSLDVVTMGSTLGRRKAVNNGNVRAIFGDKPPISTVDLHEDDFAEILTANVGKKLAVLPALMLLKLFLFTK
ncbi:hypothetical protein ACHAW5_011333 [Stephanodiscus triporus]|uniref:Uncharacterized protein n=1 Tax=Stephanodiscus triporus TaxID=2934178 RepID=A0ABD3QQ90_9STRA